MISSKVLVLLHRPTPIGHTVGVHLADSAGVRHAGAPTGRSSGRVRAAGAVLVFTGPVVVVCGTFAPWLTSGGVDRDSYAIAGVVDRLSLAGDGFGSTALSWWPLIGPIAMLPLITGMLRWWRTSAWIAIAFGLLIGIVGGAVLAVAGGHVAAGVQLAPAGPTITVVGAVIALLGGAVILLAGVRAKGPARAPVMVVVAVDDAAAGPTEPFAGLSRQRARQLPDGSQ